MTIFRCVLLKASIAPTPVRQSHFQISTVHDQQLSDFNFQGVFLRSVPGFKRNTHLQALRVYYYGFDCDNYDCDDDAADDNFCYDGDCDLDQGNITKIMGLFGYF